MKSITAYMVACWGAVSSVGIAADYIPHATLSTTYTDNARGFHDDPITEQTVNAVAGLEIRHSGPRTTLNGDINFGRREFTREHLPGESLSSGYLRGSVSIVPERLTWEAEEGYGRANSRSFTALSEVDQNDVNYFQTGPDARFVLANRYSIFASGRVIDSQFSSTDVDTRRLTGDLGVARFLTQTSQLGAAYSHRKIDYTSNPLYPGAKLDIGHLNYTVNSQRTFFVVEAGRESLVTDDGEHRSTPHGLFGLQRALSRRITLNIEYQHGFSDISDTLRSSMTDRFQQGNDTNVRLVARPFTVDAAFIMAIRNAGRLLTAVQASWLKEDFGAIASNFNRKSVGANFTAFYRLNSRWSLEAVGRWVNETTIVTDATNRLFNASLALSRQLSRSLQLGLVVERTVNHGVTVADDISENRATLAISYAPQSRGQPMFVAPNQLRFYQRTGGLAQPEVQQQQQSPAGGTR